MQSVIFNRKPSAKKIHQEIEQFLDYLKFTDCDKSKIEITSKAYDVLLKDIANDYQRKQCKEFIPYRGVRIVKRGG